jgi:hypothetical protein
VLESKRITFFCVLVPEGRRRRQEQKSQRQTLLQKSVILDYSNDARGGRRGRNRNMNRRSQSAAPDYGGPGGPLRGGRGGGGGVSGGACHTMHNPNFHNNKQPTQPFRNDRSRSSRGSGCGGNGGARREEQPCPRQPQITIFDPAEHGYARRNEWIMKKKGPLVRLQYFQAAITRSTAASVRRYLKAADGGHILDEDKVAVKSRPFNRWIQAELNEKEEDDDSKKWGWGKICLGSESAGEFWQDCLGEYTDSNGSIKITGTCNLDTVSTSTVESSNDPRIAYKVGMPTSLWNGRDIDGNNATRCKLLLHLLYPMSKGCLDPAECDAEVTDNGRVRAGSYTLVNHHSESIA